MKQKPKTPYQHLMQDFRAFGMKVAHAANWAKFMFKLQNAKAGGSWKLDDVYHRTMAAQQLGFTVELEAVDNGDLIIKYREKRPDYSDLPLNVR